MLQRSASYILMCVQFSSVAQSCPTLCSPMDCSKPGFPVHHELPEFTQTHLHQVADVMQPSHPLSSPSPPDFNFSQHRGLFQGVSSLHQVARASKFQLQHQSFQWICTKYLIKMQNPMWQNWDQLRVCISERLLDDNVIHTTPQSQEVLVSL